MTNPATFDPLLGERLGPAYRAILETLADGQWHYYAELRDIGTDAAPILPESAGKLIAQAAQCGYIERRPGQTRWRPWQARLTTTAGAAELARVRNAE